MTKHRGQLTTIKDIKTYVDGDRGTFTLVSKRTGTRFTYRIERRDLGDKVLRFVSVLNGPDNTSDFAFIGTIFPDGAYRRSAKSKVAGDAPSNVGFTWFWRQLLADAPALLEQVEVWHEGTCCRCGRTLTTPESVSTGLGPVCAERVAYV